MRNYIFSLLALGAACPAAAQQASSEDSTILVSGVSQALGSSGQTIRAFGRDEMDAVQGADFTRLLERSPGVSVNRNGPLGGFTALHVRGAEGDQLLVLVDGVRVADPASPGGGFDLGNLLMGNLAKLELQRGSNSTIWGSQALGGVLAATTGSASGVRVSAEYGTYDTRYATVGGDFGAGPVRFGVQAGHYDSHGLSAAAAGTEPDGFRQTELAARVAVQLLDRVSFFARGRYADGRLEIDGFPAPAFTLTDTAEYQNTRQSSGTAGLRYADDRLEVTTAWSGANTKRSNYDPAAGAAPTFTSDGASERAELRGRWHLVDSVALNFGAEQEWIGFSTTFDAERRTATSGAYGQLEFDRGEVHLAGGLRRDEHREFGGQWSLGGDAAWRFANGWRLTASYGEGFKAPTLFQLYSDFGNKALQPERSRSYDLGLSYEGGFLSARLTGFRRDTMGLIGFVSCFGLSGGICSGRPFGTYDNVDRARAQGVELESQARVLPSVDVSAAYTYLEAVDLTAGSPTEGNDLPRRPRQTLTLSADLHSGAARLGTDLRIASTSFDDAANTVALGSYGVVTLRGELDLGEHVTLYGRLENALDEQYETAAGYSTAGRSAYAGARARF